MVKGVKEVDARGYLSPPLLDESRLPSVQPTVVVPIKVIGSHGVNDGRRHVAATGFAALQAIHIRAAIQIITCSARRSRTMIVVIELAHPFRSRGAAIHAGRR